MDPQSSKIPKIVVSLFDVSQPYVYAIVLPPLVLFALGYRRFSVVYFFGAAGILAILGVA